MNSMKCPQCGLVNWSTAEACKRCRLPINGADAAAGANQWEETGYGYGDDNAYGYGNENAYGYQGEAAPGWGGQSGYHQGAPYAYAGYPGYADAPKQTGLAIASMVIGIISLVACGLFGVGSVLGLILGIVALVKAKNSPMQYGGQGFAIAGVTLSVFSILPLSILMAITIPNLLASRRAANEASAISTLRTINSAEATYQATAGAGKYGTLQQLGADGLIDSKLASGVRNNYVFDVKAGDISYQAQATPMKDTDRGSRSFYISEDGVIRGASKGGLPATAFDPPLIQERSPYQQNYPSESYEREYRQPAYSPGY